MSKEPINIPRGPNKDAAYQAGGSGTAAASPEEATASAEAGGSAQAAGPAHAGEPAGAEGADAGAQDEPLSAFKPEERDQAVRRKKKRHNRRRAKRLRVLAVIAVIVVALLLIAAGVLWAMVQTGSSALRPEASDIQLNDGATSANQGETVQYNGHTYVRNKNMVSVVIVGYDQAEVVRSGQASGQADAIMVLAFDTETGKATAIGIPRDSMVEVGEYVGDAYVGQDTMQICLAFSYGSGTEQGAEYTTTAVSRTLYNMPMKYYFAIDLRGVAPLNDAIGGVALTPLQSIPNTAITEGQDTVLHGQSALSYVRWRDTTQLNSSLDRQARQVQYVQAFASQALAASRNNAGLFLDMYNTLSDYSVTNLGVAEFSYLVTNVTRAGITSLDVVTLGGQVEDGGRYAEFHLDKDAVYQTVLDVYYQQID